MSKNKIILSIIWGILWIIVLFLVFSLPNSNNNKTVNRTAIWPFNIWIVWDSKTKFQTVIEDFKIKYPQYTNNEIIIESFDSYKDYYYSLLSAIVKWQAPDLFILNSSEKAPIFSDQVAWISPDLINPIDFRKKYKPFFEDDLIMASPNEDWTVSEFLLWLPVWYETLWIFYNKRYVKASDIKTLSGLNNIIPTLKKKRPDLIPIWIWNWSTVYWSSDIITQFFMLWKWINSIENLDSSSIKEPLVSYLRYWDKNWENGYNSKFIDLSTSWENNLSLFSKWETYMVIWFPRMIDEINKKWFSKNFLLASPFPHYFTWDGKTYANYNYFVINKDTKASKLAGNILKYLSSDVWAEKYLSEYPYYLPALLSLESDKLEEKINSSYNIVLWDFYDSDYLLWSFDKWVKNIYDTEITSILDGTSNYLTDFDTLKNKLICKTKKFNTLMNLSRSCE